MKKIAILLSGAGNQDGSEVTEVIGLMIALSELNGKYQCYAPAERMAEAAKICRGNIKNIADLLCDNYDALAIPGGAGATIHLSSWAKDGAKCKLHPEVDRVIKEFHKSSKPIAALCIAPVIVAKALSPKNRIALTIGDDIEVIQELEKLGVEHEICPVDDFITDRSHKIITTPCYMYDKASPAEVFKGISGLVKELIEMA